MNALIEFAPAVLFVSAWVFYGIFVATAVLIAACFGVVLLSWMRTGRVPRTQLFTALLAGVLGGLTLWLHNPQFIKLKPTALYGAFALALFASHFVGGKVLLARLPQSQIALPDAVWRRVNFAWGIFFVFCAGLNFFVATHFSEATWVKFKVFGFTALTLMFLLMHAPFLGRYLDTEVKRDDAH
ncbi:MAG: septation protein IspZ [Nevskia sp.]|nr:septation protein IspZ [Nevskia sp.]